MYILKKKVDQLLQKKLAKEAEEKEIEEFVQLLKSIKEMPPHAKPPNTMWKTEEKNWQKIKSLEAFAIDACKNDDQKRMTGMVRCFISRSVYFVNYYICLQGILWKTS